TPVLLPLHLAHCPVPSFSRRRASRWSGRSCRLYGRRPTGDAEQRARHAGRTRSWCGNATTSATWGCEVRGGRSPGRGESPHPRTAPALPGERSDPGGRRTAVEVLADEELHRAEVALGEVLEALPTGGDGLVRRAE